MKKRTFTRVTVYITLILLVVSMLSPITVMAAPEIKVAKQEAEVVEIEDSFAGKEEVKAIWMLEDVVEEVSAVVETETIAVVTSTDEGDIKMELGGSMILPLTEQLIIMFGPATTNFSMSSNSLSGYKVNNTQIPMDYGKIHDPSLAASHIQGYARYRGVGFDYHIYTHSDCNGNQGLVYFVSNTDKNITFQYKIYGDDNAQRENTIVGAKQGNDTGYWLNHPGGIQIVGDTLLIAMQGANSIGTSFSGNSQIVAVDLTPIKTNTYVLNTNNKKSCVQLSHRILKDLPQLGAMSVGAIELPQSSTTGTKNPEVRYLMMIAGASNFKYVISEPTTGSIYQANFSAQLKEVEIDSSAKYQNMALIMDNVYNIYAVGLESSSIHMYEVYNAATASMNTSASRLMNTAVSLSKHTSFRYAGGVEVTPSGELYICATEMNPRKDGIRMDQISIYGSFR